MDSDDTKKEDSKKIGKKPIADEKELDDLAKKLDEARHSEGADPHLRPQTTDRNTEIRTQESAKEEIFSDVEIKKVENASKKQVEELTNALARCMADLKNFQRRTEEDKGRFVKFANAEMLKILLPAIENLDRSCKHLPAALKEDAWAKGVLHTQEDLAKALDKIGVKRIETAGKKFDIRFHEALIKGPGALDVVIEELDPGYTLNGELIRTAKVKVGEG